MSFVGTLLNRTPVPYVARNGWRFPMFSTFDKSHQLAAMKSVGTLFAIVNSIAEAVSQVEWHMHRVAGQNDSCDECEETGVVKVDKHPALNLWNKPNKFFERQEFVQTFMQHHELTGEAWWLISRSERFPGAGPIELWPIRPDKMDVVPHPEDFIAGYIYHGPDGEKVPLGLDEVIQLRNPNPEDPYRGMGAVQSIILDIQSARLTAEWNRNFFLNSARPDFIIKVPKRLSDGEYNEITDRWDENHRGVSRVGRVGILEHEGADIETLTFSHKDMLFPELRKVSEEVIRRAYRMPAFMLGADDIPNRATADASDVFFARYLTVPRLEKLKGALNTKLLPLFGGTSNGVSFAYNNPIPEDREADDRERNSKATAFSAYVQAGVEAADAAELLGLPQLRMAPKPEPVAPSGGKKSDFAPAAHISINNGVAELENRKKGDPDPDEELKEAWELELDSLLSKWGRVTEDMVEDLYKQIRTAVDEKRVKDLSNLVLDTTKATNLLTRAMVRMAQEGAENTQRLAKEQGKVIHAYVPSESELREIAETRSELLAKSLADAAAREALRVRGKNSTGREVADAVEEHLFGLSDVYLRDQLGGALWSAEASGKTETLAEAEPSYFVANESRDKNACKPCANVSGKRFKNLQTVMRSYPNGGYHKCEGGIRCRGTFDPVWEE